MALREFEHSTQNSVPLPPKKSEVLDTWFPRSFPPDELNYRLQNTPEWVTYQKDPQEGGTRLSISQLESSLPWLLKKMGYDIELPKSPDNQVFTAAVIGTALHEANVLFNMLLEGVSSPDDIERHLPTTAIDKSAPYVKILEQFKLKPGTDPHQAEALLSQAWETFHKDPNLIEKPLMEPLIKGVGLKDCEEEYFIRQGQEVHDAGQKLAKYFIERYSNEEGKTAYPTYNEVLIVANLTCGLQIAVRLDSISAQDRDGQGMSFLVSDLKTGKRKEGNLVSDEVHGMQSGVMVVLAEKFSARNLKNGYLKPTGKACVLYNVKHDSLQGEGNTDFAYKWFDKKTGDMKDEKVQIESRSELYGKITWLGLAAKVFKAPLKNYLKTGIEKESVEKPRGKKKKTQNPFGLVQQKIDFNLPPSEQPKLEENKKIQEEFEDIMEDFNAALEDVEVWNAVVSKKTYKIGIIETKEICDNCGGKIIEDYKLHQVGKRFSKVTMDERCGTCGRPINHVPPTLVFNKNIILPET